MSIVTSIAFVSTLGAWTALALLATVSPGPDTALVIGHAARRGTRAGVLAALGVATGNLWYAALFGFGLMSILAAQPTVYLVVRIVGALYLAWIGVKMMRGALAPKPATHDVVASGRPFAQGLLTNVLNPKIALFFVAAIPQFAGNGPDAPTIGVALILVNAVVNFGWLSLVAVGVGRAGARLAGGNAQRWIEGVVGAALVGLAARVAFTKAS